MLINSYFIAGGVLQTGLTPTIDIVNIDTDTSVISGGSMIQSTSMAHHYYYDFVAYDSSINYAITVDGGVSLSGNERYHFSEIESVKDDINIIKAIETGRWRMVSNQIIFYDSDGTTPLYTFDLKDGDGNPTMENPLERVPV